MPAAKPRTPPIGVANAAKRGLKLREAFGRGGTMVGVARARDLGARRHVSDTTIKRMASYFARHAVDKRAPHFGDARNPSAGYIAWLLWGGDPGARWAEREKARLEKA